MSSSTAGNQADEAERPLVSVGIPTYNRLELLRRAVAAALAQNHRPLCLFICDNASTDGTEAYGRQLAATEPAVHYIRQAANLGPVANFEAARKAATGKYFMWLADDDWIPPDYVDQCVAVLEAEPSVALVAGIATYFERGILHHEGRWVNAFGDDPVKRVLDYYRHVSDNGVFYGLFRLEVLDQARPLRRQMGADWLLLAEIAVLGEIRTLSSIEIRRDLAGDRSYLQIAEAGGLSRFEGRHPHAAVAGFIAWDALFGSQVFRVLGVRRFVIAARAPAIILARFVAWPFLMRLLYRRGLDRYALMLEARVRARRRVQP